METHSSAAAKNVQEDTQAKFSAGLWYALETYETTHILDSLIWGAAAYLHCALYQTADVTLWHEWSHHLLQAALPVLEQIPWQHLLLGPTAEFAPASQTCKASWGLGKEARYT